MDYREVLKEYDFIQDKEKFFENLVKPKPVYFRVNTIKENKENIINALLNYEDLEIEKSEFIENYFIVKKGNISKKPEHLLGYLYIQDLASAAVVYSFSKKQNVDLVIDLCASPGGKAILLASIFPNSTIIANDIGSDRIKSLIHNVQRMGTINIIVTQCNAKFFPFITNKEIDFILADVPCSAESNLDDYYNYNINKHKNFVDYVSSLQYSILSRAVDISYPSTEIVYSTCTFNPLENEYNVDRCIKEKGIKVLPVKNLLPNFSNGILRFKELSFDDNLRYSVRIEPINMGGMFLSKILPNKKEVTPDKSLAIITKDKDHIYQVYKIKEIDPSFVYESLKFFGIPLDIISDYFWFYKDKEDKISEIFVKSNMEFLVKQKGPLTVEYFGLKALRFFKPLKIYKPTSSFLTLMNRYISDNFVELKFDVNLLKRFLSRQEIDLSSFKEQRLNGFPFVAVKYNGLVIGCAVIKNGKIISEIPSSKAQFIIQNL